MAALCLAIGISISATTTEVGRAAFGLPPLVTKAYARSGPPVEVSDDVQNILLGRCSMCHSAEPLYPGIVTAPRGILLDTPEHMDRYKDLILIQAALTHAMPPNNVTEISPEERAELKAWATAK